jgi:perosamine synthetase
MNSKQVPAFLGGSPSVSVPPPHFEWPPIEKRDEEAVIKQLYTAVSVYGRQGIIREFEDAFLDYINEAAARPTRLALATNNGTSALYAAYFGCGIGPGDEVIIPSYAFHATATPLLHCNAIPVFCDVLHLTGNIDIEDARARVTERTKAIVVNHMWGHPADLDSVLRLCGQYGLYLIEDCSHAHGATYYGQRVGTFGDVACFSLQGSKMLTAGEGGILVTSNQVVYERANLLADSRLRPSEVIESEKYRQFLATGYGLKFRMHPLGAALVREQLKRLDEWIAWRESQLDYLTSKLRDIAWITPPHTDTNVTRGAFFGYECLFDREMSAEEIELYIAALQAEGVDISRTDITPLHLLPLFSRVNDHMYQYDCPKRCPYAPPYPVYGTGDLPVSEDRYARAFHLPTFTLPESRQLIDQYALAFHKVSENFGVIRKELSLQ